MLTALILTSWCSLTHYTSVIESPPLLHGNVAAAARRTHILVLNVAEMAGSHPFSFFVLHQWSERRCAIRYHCDRPAATDP